MKSHVAMSHHKVFIGRNSQTAPALLTIKWQLCLMLDYYVSFLEATLLNKFCVLNKKFRVD